MATGLGNFEVRILNKGKWVTDSRGSDEGAAIASANKFAADRSNDGVKVVEETYDEDKGTFRERTVFSYFNQEDKVLAGERAAEMLASARARQKMLATSSPLAGTGPSQKSKARRWLMIAALVLGIGGNVIFVLLLGDRFGINMDAVSASLESETRAVVYDLPEITANVRSGNQERVVHIKVGLHLRDRRQNAAVERKLSDIVSRMAADLNRFDSQDKQIDLQELRKQLKKGVQAAGDTEIEGLILKEVLMF